jgi:RHS repeat-associated protein
MTTTNNNRHATPFSRVKNFLHSFSDQLKTTFAARSPSAHHMTNRIPPAPQNLARFIANIWPVARKEQRAFRGEGDMANNDPGMRFTSSGLRLLISFFKINRLTAVYFSTALFAFFFLASHAEARIVREKPKVSFYSSYLPGGTYIYFDTAEAALAASVSYVNSVNQCPRIFANLRPNSNAYFYYGVADSYDVDKTISEKNNDGVCTPYPPQVDQLIINRYYECDVENGWNWGYEFISGKNSADFCQKTIPDKEPDQNICIPTPTQVTSGVKDQTEVDYTSNTGVSFSRRYRSTAKQFSSVLSTALVDNTQKNELTGSCRLGTAYKRNNQGIVIERYPYCYPYLGTGAVEYQLAKTSGYTTVFTGVPTSTTKPANLNESAVQLTDTQGVKTWRVKDENDAAEIYSASGLLQTKTTRSGQLTTFAYSNASTPTTIASRPNLMISQTGVFGHTLQWRYDANGLMTKMIDPAGREYDYAYDANLNLVSVTFPPAFTGVSRTSKTYHYEDPTNTKLLTGITDENGKRYATYTYNAQGQVTETKHFAAPGVEVNKHQLSYPNTVQTTVIDPLNTSRTYTYTNILNYDAVTGISQPCASCGGSNAQNMTYDANRNVTSRTDFQNNRTNTTYDLTRNLELTRTEGLTAAGATTAATRKTLTTWHPTFRIPTSIIEKSVSLANVETSLRETTFTHDANGNVLTRSVKDSASAIVRTSTYTYDVYGRVLTAKDPRNNTTTNTYYPNTAAQNTTLANSRGMLASSTNALGHVTNYTAYDANGRVLSMTDANGLVTTMTYHPRGWLLTRTVGVGLSGAAGSAETTTYDYDGVGQLIKVTLPDLSFMAYTYDDAHRLTAMQDSEGSKITYTLDAMGNRTGEAAFDPANTLARSRSRVYDALNRLQKDIGATNPATQITQYAYDNQGNLTTTTDALNHSNTNAYDALNRLITATDPNNGQSQYSYNALDQLTNVKDAKNLNTTYTYNAFGEVTTQLSPDTGTTSFTYDAAGNMLTKTDARGATAKYVYDALNRATQTKFYPTLANANANTSSDETRTYTFDTCSNGKGRLCSLVDKAGTITFGYDLKGRIIGKSQLATTLTQTHSYRYNSTGQMDQWTTASGQIVGYTYANNKITGITVNGVALISNVLYDPFGPPVGWLWPSATTPALKTYRDYDLDGRMTRWELKNGVSYIQRDVTWDNANRVTQLKDLLTPISGTSNNPQVFGYDNLDRLTTTTLGTATTAAQILAYDAIGNRTSATINGIVATYNLPTTSHKLTSTAGGTNPRAFTYDAMGNLTSDGKYTTTYGNNGRMTKVTWLTGTTTNTASYDISALGQRIRKVTPTAIVGTRRFMYDEAGHLTGEYDGTGKLIQETVWLGDIPIATLRPKAASTTTPIAIDTFYVHADHLGTPRVITRPSDNKVVWSWESTEAFGNNAPNENPSALGVFTYNLRMPGQQFDRETGTFYNYFRDYDPQLGRYVQSDPIGLKGGANTFAYVEGMPLSLADKRGLSPDCCSSAAAVAAMGANNGVVMCCGGKLVACTGNFDKLSDYTQGAVRKCAGKHEQDHIDDGHATCNGCDEPGPAKFGPGVNGKQAECSTWKKDLECMEKEKRKECGIGSAGAACRSAFNSYIEEAKGKVEIRYDCKL